jgi:HSP20 family molecular chaperone IbpA
MPDRGSGIGSSSLEPIVDVYETDSRMTVKAELAGCG